MNMTPAQILFRVLLIGVGATLVMDIWAFIAEALFAIPQSNFAMVGRWIGHMPEGVFAHDSIRNYGFMTKPLEDLLDILLN